MELFISTAYRIGCGDFLELLRRSLVSAGPVRVVLQREFLVGGVDFLLGRSRRDLFGCFFFTDYLKKKRKKRRMCSII